MKNDQGTSVQTSHVGMQEEFQMFVYLESLDKLVVQLHPVTIKKKMFFLCIVFNRRGVNVTADPDRVGLAKV